jgi:hypothetical protein
MSLLGMNPWGKEDFWFLTGVARRRSSGPALRVYAMSLLGMNP